VILSFKDKRTEQIWEGRAPRMDAVLQQKVQLKLRYIAVAVDVNDLRIPPGNRL
jgi:plasmid maintenance system killer protein